VFVVTNWLQRIDTNQYIIFCQVFWKKHSRANGNLYRYNKHMANKRVVILTGKAGMGHLSVASALDYWTRKFGYNSEVIDIIPSSSDRIYQLTMKIPQIHAAFYRSSNNLLTAEIMVKSFLREFSRKLKRYSPLYQQSDIIISTHPLIHPTIGKNKIMTILDPYTPLTAASL